MLTPEIIAAFRAAFRGEVIEPEDARYHDARKVYNAMIDRKPRLIAQCTDVADVMTAIRFARKTGLKVSIRGGGHNAGGLGVCDDGLVHRSRAHPLCPRRSLGAHRPGGRRMQLERRGPRHARFRLGSALGSRIAAPASAG